VAAATEIDREIVAETVAETGVGIEDASGRVVRRAGAGAGAGAGAAAAALHRQAIPRALYLFPSAPADLAHHLLQHHCLLQLLTYPQRTKHYMPPTWPLPQSEPWTTRF
jgi:hypothetical protein